MHVDLSVLVPISVGIVTCVIGVATFVSAKITSAKQDGILIAKIEQCVSNTEEIKKDMKEKNREVDSILDEHSKDIVEIKTQIRNIYKQINLNN